MSQTVRETNHLAHAEQIYAGYQRNMLTDLCLLLFAVGGSFFCASIVFPDFWQALTKSRQGALGNWVMFLSLTASIFTLVKFSKSQRTLSVAAAMFVVGSFVMAVTGMVFSGFGVRALAFYILPITLTFVTFHYGVKIAARSTALGAGLVVLAIILESLGLIRVATPDHQPFAFVAMTLTAMSFITLNVLYVRFEQRFKHLLARYEEQWMQLQDSLRLMQLSLARKRSFSKLLSHSTRTPLAGVQFVLELLGRNNLSAAVHQRTLNALERHAFRLRMMGVHLDLARRARDHDPLPAVHSFNPYEVWAVCLPYLSTEASARNIALEFSVQAVDATGQITPASGQPLDGLQGADSDTPQGSLRMSVAAEPQVLAELIQLLADNAIKSQTGGAISISLGYRRDDVLVIEVKDQGIGMNQARAAELMRPLGTIIDDHSHDTGDGLGLGLPVLRSICDQMGGHCTYHPNPAGGSIFSVYLPVKAEATVQRAGAAINADSTANKQTIGTTESERTNTSPSNIPFHESEWFNGLEKAEDPAANAETFMKQKMSSGSMGSKRLDENPFIRQQLADRGKRVFGVYMGLIVAVIAMSVSNQGIQALMGSELGRQSFINGSLAALFAAFCTLLFRKGRTTMASGLLVATFLIFAFNAMVIIGLGPRAPVAILPAAAVALAHFQFGARIGSITCVIAAASLVFAYILEFNGLIPGTSAEIFPPSINVVLAIIPVYVLGFVCAYEMQGRSEITLQAMRDQNHELEATIYKAMLADFSQNRFLQAVSPRLISQCQELADICAELARQSAACIQDSGSIHCLNVVRLREQAAALNKRVTEEFDDAVGAVQVDAHEQTSQKTSSSAADAAAQRSSAALSPDLRRIA